MQKINLNDLQNQISSRHLKESEPGEQPASLGENELWGIWERMTAIYRHAWTSSEGEEPSEHWATALRGVTPEQIELAFTRILDREGDFPPNVVEFRKLCLPATISPDGKNSTAYLSFHDPRHPRNDPNSPEYVKQTKGIESDTIKSKRRETGNAALSALKDLL